jgi:hypothetical protein
MPWRSIGPAGQGGRADDIAVHPTDARVLVHPKNPDVVWVAATGHLFGANPAG